MQGKLSAKLQSATKMTTQPYNILTFNTHERYQDMLAYCNVEWYALDAEGLKTWDTSYAPIPSNYHILDRTLSFENQLPDNVVFDAILSHTKAGQWEIGQSFSSRLNIPHITCNHVYPSVLWARPVMWEWSKQRGDYNVYISKSSLEEWWGDDDPNCRVIEHGVDLELFKPVENYHRGSHVLAVVNDWINRDHPCGYTFWQLATEGLPTKILGKTPGLSEPARSLDDLAFAYQTSLIFANTAHFSPIPSVMLEAMACGCAVVTTPNKMIESIIESGHNGFICSTPKLMKDAIRFLFDNKDFAKQIGLNARKTIEERFSLGRFVDNWNLLFDEVIK